MPNTSKPIENDMVREKLIEICFHEFCEVAGDSPCGCDGCPYGKYGSENGECYEAYKKHKKEKLIANGVTVQKWIPVSERLPDNDIRVLVYLDREVYKHTHVDTDRRHNDYWVRWRNYVTHWMPLPTPPKEPTP